MSNDGGTMKYFNDRKEAIMQTNDSMNNSSSRFNTKNVLKQKKNKKRIFRLEIYYNRTSHQ